MFDKIYPDYDLMKYEFSHTAIETEEPGYMINISGQRATALLYAAWLHVTDPKCEVETIPNGNFSDIEVALWELFCQAIRAGKEVI